VVCATVADLVLLNVSEYPSDMSGNPNPVTQCHILEDLNPEENGCGNFTSRRHNGSCTRINIPLVVVELNRHFILITVTLRSSLP